MKHLIKNPVTLVIAILFILIPVGYLSVSSSQERAVVESCFLLFVSALVFIEIATAGIARRLTQFEWICLAFVLCLLLKNLFGPQINLPYISYATFYLFLFFGLKNFFTRRPPFIPFILLSTLAVSLLFYFFLATYIFYTGSESFYRQAFQNQSIFSIYLAAQLVLIIPLYLHFKSYWSSYRLFNWSCLIVITLSLLLLILLQGRSGWLGFCLAVIYIFYQYSHDRVKKNIIRLAIPLGVLLFFLLYWYKPASSNGRLFVYKVAAEMLKDHWLWGIGGGQFKVYYNQYQAAYFASNNIDSEEALLADNTFYVFNDFYQLIIENGIIGFLFLIIAILAGVRHFRKAKVAPQHRPIYVASGASLLSILLGSLFSYPLQIFPIIFLVVVCLAILISFSNEKEAPVYLSSKVGIGIRVALLIPVSFLLIYFYYNFHYFQKSLAAFELQRAGFRQEALREYKELSASYIKEGSDLFIYAQELYNTNQLVPAAQVLSLAKRYYCTSNVYKLSAQIEQELQSYEQAEKDYKKAVFMVPNRMINRYDLLKYYIQIKDTTEIKYWSNLIINMPVKIPSPLTKSIQEHARQIMINISKTEK